MKNFEKVFPPSCDLVLIALCVESSEGHVPLTLSDDTPVYLGHGSVITTSVSGSLGVEICRSGSRSQLFNRTNDGPAECIQWYPLQPPVESSTHLSANFSEGDEILVVGHRVLGSVSHKFAFVELEKRTLIVVRRRLTEAKAVRASGMLQASLATFTTPINPFNTSKFEIGPLCPFCRWGVEASIG